MTVQSIKEKEKKKTYSSTYICVFNYMDGVPKKRKMGCRGTQSYVERVFVIFQHPSQQGLDSISQLINFHPHSLDHIWTIFLPAS
jgi:hypothetical protein